MNGDDVLISNSDYFEVIVYNRRDDRVERVEMLADRIWSKAIDYV